MAVQFVNHEYDYRQLDDKESSYQLIITATVSKNIKHV